MTSLARKKGLAIVLAAATALTSFGFTTGIAHADSVSGTLNITTQQAMNSWVTGTDYKDADSIVNLGTDVTVSAPVTSFAGTFNGEGNTITLALNTSDGNTAFIGTLASTGSIDNVNFSGSVTSSTSGDYVAAVAGYNSGTISNVTNTASVSASSAYNVGGIAGFNNVGMIENCTNNNTVTGRVKIGGIVGENAGTIQDCANESAVTSNYVGKCGIGGIAGRNGNNNTATETGVISDCDNSGDISCSNGKWVGGIAGFQNALSSNSGCRNTGLLSGVGYVGQLVGQDEGTTTGVTPVIGGETDLYGSDLASLQSAIATAGADGTIWVHNTVTLGSSVTINDNVNIVRAAGFTGPMFTVSTGSSDVYVTLTSMTVDGNGYGALFNVTSGRLRLRGNITLCNARTAVEVQNGAAVELNRASVTGRTYSVDAKSGGSVIYNNFGDTTLSGTVYLENTSGANDAYITLKSEVTSGITVKVANPVSGYYVAVADSTEIASSSASYINYYGNSYTVTPSGVNLVI